jgi:DNA-binding NtrC family response regulator
MDPQVQAPAAARGDLSGVREAFCGTAPAALLDQLARAAASDLPVLLEGAAGAGKRRLALALHILSPRRGAPFVALRARSLQPARFEADLFGELAGEAPCPLISWEGREGLAARAEGGTLLLEEVGDLPLASQAKLVRFLDGRIRPMGAAAAGPVDLRIVSTSSRELRAEVRAGRFRADLYFRLRGILLRVPSPGGWQDELPVLATPGVPSLRELRRSHERDMVQAALAAQGWNVSAAARDLGLSRVGLCKKLKVLGLSRPSRPGRPIPAD